ncbi:MAG: right-handed parallel beta-helix repeat-containing protein [Caldilineaceae bacterium]|nr:right-handed parallel beta-helix repeat-containing protein [Caldilineaceae bacterium]
MQSVASPPTRHTRWLVPALLLLLWLGRPGVAQASCGGTTLVGDTASLNAAIVAFNAVTSGPCIFEIELTGDIVLSADVTPIDNVTAGVELVVDGAGHRVEGRAWVDDGEKTIEVFHVRADTNVTVANAAVAQGLTGIYNAGMLTVTDSTISRNYRTGIVNDGGTVTVMNSILADNDSVPSGNDGTGLVNSEGAATVTNSTISGNSNHGIANDRGLLTVTNSRISDNRKSGIDNVEGTVTVANSIVSGNALVTGWNWWPAGISNYLGSVTVTDSTISGNRTDGINNDSGTLRVANTTISGNDIGVSTISRSFSPTEGTVSLVNTTISGNASYGISNARAAVTLTNSVVADTLRGPDCENLWTLGAQHSLVERADSGCADALAAGTGNIIGKDPLLGALQDNGCAATAGAPDTAACVPTRAPLAGSPALNAGRNDLAKDPVGALLTSDQRGAGYLRIVDATVDMGAYEGSITCSVFDGANTVTVDTTSALNRAIACYNALSTVGVYTIKLANDIILTEDIQVIDNATVGAELVIDGGGYSVDGDSLRYDTFTIARDTAVTLEKITIIHSRYTGIYVLGMVTVADSVVSGSGGSGIYTQGGALNVAGSTIAGAEYEGVFVDSGTFAVTGSTISGNGSGIKNDLGTGSVSNSTISDNGDDSYSFSGISNSGTMTVTNTIISGNNPSGIKSFGTLNVGNSAITGNAADGVYGSGDTTVSNSTISGNRSSGIAGEGRLTVTNSTISANGANGIQNRYMLTVTNATIFGNGGNGVYNAWNGNSTVVNSVLADSGSGVDCFTEGNSPTIASSLVESADASCGVSDGEDGNIVGQDPVLGPLTDNGCAQKAGVPGAAACVQTHALLADSPALDKGNNDLAVDVAGIPLATDQRGAGYPRIGSGSVDMGAYEGFATCSTFDEMNAAQVETTSALNEAIACYNALTTPGLYTITLTNDITLTENLLAVDNTAVDVALVIAGEGHSVDGDSQRYHAFTIAADTWVTIDAIAITNSGGNGVSSLGTLTVADSTIADAEHSGIFNDGGSLTLINSSIADNGGSGINNKGGTGTVVNSAISSNRGSDSFFGGSGIGNTSGAMTVSNSTISGNSDAGMAGDGTLIVVNSTVSENGGSGINSQGVLTITNSTLSGNGVGAGLPAGATVMNSLLADTKSGTDCYGAGLLNIVSSLVENPDFWCVVVDGEDGNMVGQDPLLGPLTDNGCAVEAGVPSAAACVKTHALLAGSPALDAGSNDLAVDERSVALATDQRGAGYPRIVNSVVDMGAFERGDDPAPATYPLTVVIEGNGTVVDTSSAQGHEATYQVSVVAGTAVTLTATAATGSVFSGWSGACSGMDECTVNMTGAQSVTATFTLHGPVFLPLIWR